MATFSFIHYINTFKEIDKINFRKYSLGILWLLNDKIHRFYHQQGLIIE